MTRSSSTPGTCPCGLPEPYDDCCGRFHTGAAAAPTAELLMRSRYTAFAVGDTGYLRRTWHPRTRPRRLALEPEQVWTRLEILSRSGGVLFTTHGIVEFAAHYTRRGRPGVLHEHSRFVREDGVWLYFDGTED
ncbi:YchJ family protein [Pseudonocardia benzenivorans]|uniref:UPF0225 protein Psed_4059 n=2 Tax=Pseudonocardia TaxID=1847 RepID=F4CRL4_PSEUX|nr:YchJ family protein [Pseudonocardia dioxanivorans]AEA26222.1 UPF0225 protein ychJ [Pseudonocardia dioxanivorans CB1190]GJF03303.1 UPF0225 protein [Pseudonocardia sp. D17]